MGASDFQGNSLGIKSDSPILSPGQILFGGTLTPGNSVTVRITVAGTNNDFTQNVVSGDTLFSVIGRLVTQINAALGANMTALLANPTVPMLAISPFRNGSPLPTVAAFCTGAITSTVVSQPVNILDANPVFYTGHINPLAAPQPGDSVALHQQVGPDADHPTQATVAYSWQMTRIVDPNLATLRGAVDVGTAAPKPANGYVAPVYSYSRGFYLFDADGNIPAGADKGYGTFNLPASGGYFVGGLPIKQWLASQRASFRAHLSADQVGIPDNQITRLDFTVVPVVTATLYDSTNRRWAPPAGMIKLGATAMWADVSPNSFYLYIFKNGEILAGRHIQGNAANSTSNSVDVVDYASGSDYYDCRVLILTGSGAHTIRGLPYYTWFQGETL